jgi:hypothetical protein
MTSAFFDYAKWLRAGSRTHIDRLEQFTVIIEELFYMEQGLLELCLIVHILVILYFIVLLSQCLSRNTLSYYQTSFSKSFTYLKKYSVLFYMCYMLYIFVYILYIFNFLIQLKSISLNSREVEK